MLVLPGLVFPISLCHPVIEAFPSDLFICSVNKLLGGPI
jgi:hypothetical protein